MRKARVLIVEARDINSLKNDFKGFMGDIYIYRERGKIIHTDEDDQESYEEEYNIDEQIRVQQLKEMVWPPLPYCDSS